MTDMARTDEDERPIVVGIDGSSEAVAALRWAAQEARVHSRSVIVMTVNNPLAYAVPFAPVGEIQAVIDLSNKSVLDEALTQVYGHTDPESVTRVVREGNPAQVLIDASQDASLLVVGARGRGSFPLGSVSDRCVRHAMSPVVVVR